MGKQKKEKIIYIDDGRTIADMSNVSGGFRNPQRPRYVPPASLGQQLKTYWNAMKMMFLPRLAVIGGIMLIFVIVLIAFSLAY